MREMAYDRVKVNRENMKKDFDRKIKEGNFQINDLVLKWDATKEDKPEKFDQLWKGPYIVVAYRGYNSFILQYQNGIDIGVGHVNGGFLKHYIY